MNKKRIIVLAVLGLFLILGVGLIVMGINLDENSLPDGSFINSYDYIQGDFNKDSLDKVSRAYIENITVKYGKETVTDENNKTVEAIFLIPDFTNIIEESKKKYSKELELNKDMDYSEHLSKFQDVFIAELNNSDEKTEKKINIKMTKENSTWKIVLTDEFVDAIMTPLLDGLRENMNKGV